MGLSGEHEGREASQAIPLQAQHIDQPKEGGRQEGCAQLE